MTGQATTPSHWTHYKQARHAGCLYEKSEWHYGYGTYEQIFLASYYQGYGGFDLGMTTSDWVAAYDESNALSTEYSDPYRTDDKQGTNQVEPIWWHFFNAHILPNPQNPNCLDSAALPSNHLGIEDTTAPITYACPTVPRSDIVPTTSDFSQPELTKAIPLVMANPAYEGLGYLNFIVEYKNYNRDVGEDYLEFIDSTPAMDGTDNYNGLTNTDGFRGKSTYREINNCNASSISTNFGSNAAEQECTGWGENLGNWSGVHGMFYYDLYMGSWLIYPAVGGNAAAGSIEHYRTWVSYPFTSTAGTAVTFSPTDYNNNFNGEVDNWSMATYDFQNTAHNSDGGNNIVNWSLDHDLVVSSFPHNNLGKDFRFNLRVLQGALAGASTDLPSSSAFFTSTKQGTNQIYRSYYFYKINQIDIRFPYFVAYALHHENRGHGLDTTETRTEDGLFDEGNGLDWSGKSDSSTSVAAQWSGGYVAGTTTAWCDNSAQCGYRGQQWWNTLNNDIVHPLTYDANGELYRHMDTTTLRAYNSNNDASGLSSIVSEDMLDDYQFMHVSLAHTRSNIIPPVDLGTHSPGVNKHSPSNNGGGEIEFHRIMGFIKKAELTAGDSGLAGSTHASGSKYNTADWCDTRGGHTDGSNFSGTMGDDILERTCGIDFRIIGLMNTYDERRGQRGTYQEIWVQLQYAIGKGGRDGVLSSCGLNDRLDNGTTDARADCETRHPVQSPHPYLHFMASEIIKIEATCNTVNVNNPNRCVSMKMGPGESNNAAYGGK